MGGNWRHKNGLEDIVLTTETGCPINRDVLKVEVNRIVAAHHVFVEGCLLKRGGYA